MTEGRQVTGEHVCVDCPQPCPECDYCAVEAGRKTTGEAQIIKALHYLIGKAHLLQAGVDTLTEQEYALLEDVARWYDEQRGVADA